MAEEWPLLNYDDAERIKENDRRLTGTSIREPNDSYVHDDPIAIEIEARLARIETKQDALYTEIHDVRLEFAKLVEGVMGAMTSNPLLSRLLGGGKKER